MNTCDASLTVLVSVHNAEATIVGEIETLLDSAADRGRRFEILVVDDASTDHTWEIVCELRTRYPQIRGMRNACQLGLGRSIEMARDAARGDLAIGRQGRIIAVDRAAAAPERSPSIAPTIVPDYSLPIPAVPRPLGQKRLQRLAAWAGAVAESEELWNSPLVESRESTSAVSPAAAIARPNVPQKGVTEPVIAQGDRESCAIDAPKSEGSRTSRRNSASFLDHLRTMSFGPQTF